MPGKKTQEFSLVKKYDRTFETSDLIRVKIGSLFLIGQKVPIFVINVSFLSQYFLETPYFTKFSIDLSVIVWTLYIKAITNLHFVQKVSIYRLKKIFVVVSRCACAAWDRETTDNKHLNKFQEC